MANQDHSFLFIPDISGFTNFVNNTDIEHSQHIISELLEIIIDANDLGMTVSEIEGDAVLFYRKEMPTQLEITSQAEKMFLKFHEHLHRYNIQRICDCGACTSAAKLTLKFVAHSGAINMIKVKDFEKPYGQPVIVAHRLLKNEIKSSEYILLTEDLYSHIEEKEIPNSWINWVNSSTSYDDVGELSIFHSEMSELHKQVPLISEPKAEYKSDSPVVETIFINQPIEQVYNIIVDFRYRKEWNVGVKEVQYEENKVNRKGSKHVCLINGQSIKFETLGGLSDKKFLVYGERAENIPFTKDVANYFKLEAKDNGTFLTFESHIIPNGFIGKIMSHFIKKNFKKSSIQNLKTLKEFCEIKFPKKKLSSTL